MIVRIGWWTRLWGKNRCVYCREPLYRWARVISDFPIDKRILYSCIDGAACAKRVETNDARERQRQEALSAKIKADREDRERQENAIRDRAIKEEDPARAWAERERPRI